MHTDDDVFSGTTMGPTATQLAEVERDERRSRAKRVTKRAASTTLVRVRDEAGDVDFVPLDDFLDACARDFDDEELRSFRAGDSVYVTPKGRAPYSAQIER